MPIPGVRKTAGLIDVSVVCGVVTVALGDVVVADEEGIVVLPKGQAEAILAQAASRADKDAKTTLADWGEAPKARTDELTRSLGIQPQSGGPGGAPPRVTAPGLPEGPGAAGGD